MDRTLPLGLFVGLLALGVYPTGCSNSSGGASEKPGNKGAGGAASTSPGFDLTHCRECTAAQCPSEDSQCGSTAGCIDMLDCYMNCDRTDAVCMSNCVGSRSLAAQTAAASFATCAWTKCVTECAPTVDINVGGAGNVGSAGGAGNAGGNRATGGAGTGGAITTQPGENWIHIENSWADPGMPPNGLLKVSGAMYAYKDDCSNISYDAVNGCISGTLCMPDSTGANWGAGIGFDFSNTGENGVPANTKAPWDATAIGAVGFGWKLHDRGGYTGAPNLKVWITNMDPSWNGQCSADDCGINGPPDGESDPAFTGTVRFSSMVKDNWGGSGTKYTFDPKNILAIQFKVSASESDKTDVYFCVDGISIILP